MTKYPSTTRKPPSVRYKELRLYTGQCQNFLKYIGKEMFRKISALYIRPRLEYPASVGSYHMNRLVNLPERVQQRALNICTVPEVREPGYGERIAGLQEEDIQNTGRG